MNNNPRSSLKTEIRPPKKVIGSGDPTPISKVFALLELLAKRGSARLTDLAADLGLPKTTLHRIVAQLQDLGYLQRELKSRHLTVAPRLIRLSSGLIGTAARAAPRHAILEGLATRLGESCSLGILVGYQVVYIDDVTATSPLTISFQAGQHTPLHCTSTGKLFLAYMEPKDLERYFASETLTKYTPNTITEPERLRPLLPDIVKAGFARSENEFVLGVVGAAVPVLDSNGRILAALNVSIPSVRMTAQDLASLKNILTVAAAEIAEMFE